MEILAEISFSSSISTFLDLESRVPVKVSFDWACGVNTFDGMV